MSRQRVAEAIRRHGAARVARAVGASREAVLAYACDAPQQPATALFIEQRMAALDLDEPADAGPNSSSPDEAA